MGNFDMATFIRKKKQEDYEWMSRHDEMIREAEEEGRKAEIIMLPKLRRALWPARAYNKWLRRFLGQGGIPTHYYDYDYPDKVYIADRDLTILPLYGSMSITIIAKEDVRIDAPDGYGHIKVYQFGRYTNSFVPVYSDVQGD